MTGAAPLWQTRTMPARMPRTTRNPITPALIRRIAGLTDENATTQAGVVLAEALGDKLAQKTLKAIETVSVYAGETPYDLVSIRLRILRTLWRRAQDVAPPATVNALRGAF